MTNSHGGTHVVMYRKDRVRFIAGQEQLAEFRLTSEATTRRVFARCCHTPVFLEFENGHWLSLYAALWSRSRAAPQIQLRTMTMDLPDRGQLPSDVPNPKRWTAGFMARLFFAWVAMGFRAPKVAVHGEFGA